MQCKELKIRHLSDKINDKKKQKFQEHHVVWFAM
jgi:hypothetical protein